MVGQEFEPWSVQAVSTKHATSTGPATPIQVSNMLAFVVISQCPDLLGDVITSV